MAANIFFSADAASTLRIVLAHKIPSLTAFIYPEDSDHLLLDSLNAPDILNNSLLIPHKEGEKNKTISSATEVWQRLLSAGADRKSAVVNLGGGMTSDLGGFAAACYMRGIDYINIPTTLLSAVDASCGGKTGVNLNEVKNIVGAFRMPYATIISPQFLHTLPEGEILSGWAEMLKHALLLDLNTTHKYLSIDPLNLTSDEWLPLIKESVDYKQRIVEADPQENGLRRILNLGHTAGHAFEAYFNSRNTHLTHGHAVAFGLVTALILSNMMCGFPSDTLYKYAQRVKELYPTITIHCDDYPTLLSLMHHDKKNRGSKTVNFVLLKSPGEPVEAYPVSDTDIRTALDITRDLLGC